MYFSEYRERNYGEKYVKFCVELQQYEACTAVTGRKTKTQNKTINGLDYDTICSVETHIIMNGI
jgi:hypothetical protein